MKSVDMSLAKSSAKALGYQYVLLFENHEDKEQETRYAMSYTIEKIKKALDRPHMVYVGAYDVDK